MDCWLLYSYAQKLGVDWSCQAGDQPGVGFEDLSLRALLVTQEESCDSTMVHTAEVGC